VSGSTGIDVGIDSFAAAYDEASLAVSPSQRLRDLVEQIEHADHVGSDVFGIGEHHRKDYLDSAPPIILAAAATRTQRIRLTRAVTVLSAADPVRVFQNFATLDLLSRTPSGACTMPYSPISTTSSPATSSDRLGPQVPGAHIARLWPRTNSPRGWSGTCRAAR